MLNVGILKNYFLVNKKYRDVFDATVVCICALGILHILSCSRIFYLTGEWPENYFKYLIENNTDIEIVLTSVGAGVIWFWKPRLEIENEKQKI